MRWRRGSWLTKVLITVCYCLSQPVLRELQQQLNQWLQSTYDPWRCAPHGVLFDVDQYADDPICAPLYNRLKQT